MLNLYRILYVGESADFQQKKIHLSIRGVLKQFSIHPIPMCIIDTQLAAVNCTLRSCTRTHTHRQRWIHRGSPNFSGGLLMTSTCLAAVPPLTPLFSDVPLVRNLHTFFSSSVSRFLFLLSSSRPIALLSCLFRRQSPLWRQYVHTLRLTQTFCRIRHFLKTSLRACVKRWSHVVELIFNSLAAPLHHAHTRRHTHQHAHVYAHANTNLHTH